eukprot:5554251-Prymnesium_polylepis.1
MMHTPLCSPTNQGICAGLSRWGTSIASCQKRDQTCVSDFVQAHRRRTHAQGAQAPPGQINRPTRGMSSASEKSVRTGLEHTQMSLVYVQLTPRGAP